jgi:hypothetical protein
MYEINPKFLHADGSVNTESARAEGRKARAEAFQEGCNAISELFGRLVRSNTKPTSAILDPTLSTQASQT